MRTEHNPSPPLLLFQYAIILDTWLNPPLNLKFRLFSNGLPNRCSAHRWLCVYSFLSIQKVHKYSPTEKFLFFYEFLATTKKKEPVLCRAPHNTFTKYMNNDFFVHILYSLRPLVQPCIPFFFSSLVWSPHRFLEYYADWILII